MQGQRNTLNGMRVAILVATDFEQAELVEPRKALEQAGAKVTLISPKSGQIKGMNHDQMADTFNIDITLDQANPDDFDALHLPGGALNADFLRAVPKALEFVRDFDEKNKPISIICHAPWLLVSANLVNGRNLTSYYTIQDDIRNAGGHWLDEPAVRDRNWVTSRQPDDIPNNFNPAMIELFRSSNLRTSSKRRKAWSTPHSSLPGCSAEKINEKRKERILVMHHSQYPLVYLFSLSKKRSGHCKVSMGSCKPTIRLAAHNHTGISLMCLFQH